MEGISIFTVPIVIHMDFQESNINDDNSKTIVSSLKQQPFNCISWFCGSRIWAGAQLVDFSVLHGINWGYSLALSWWLVWRIQNYFTQMSGVFMGNLEDWAQQSASPSLCSLRAFPCGLFSRVARLFNITVQVWTWESIPRDEAKSTSKVWVQKLAQQYFCYSTDQSSHSLPRFKGKGCGFHILMGGVPKNLQ